MTRKRTEVDPNQLVIPPYHEQLVREDQYPPIDPDSRIGLASMVERVSEVVHFGREPSYRDYLHADPTFIARGLYISPVDESYDHAHHVVRLGVWRRRGSNSET